MPEQPCAFHADRLTAVSCAQCARPICPEDMIDAPVGVQCPICAGRMRDGALGQTAYRVRSRTEGWPIARLLQGSSITQLIIGINVGVFVLMYLTGRPTATRTLVDFGAIRPDLPRGEWWRLFTAMFVHIGFLHLLFNMYSLMIFGASIEARYGRARFLALYLTSGFLGSAASIAFNGRSFSAGASGAVFGALGAWVAFFVRHHAQPGARGQLRSLAFLVGINVYFGLATPGIDNSAHMGGLIGGFVIGMGLELGARVRGPRALLGPLAFVLVAMTAIVLALPHLL